MALSSRKCRANRQHVAVAGAQRRHAQLDHAQAEVQVGAKGPLRHHQLERPVGRGHDPHVHRLLLHRAKPAHLAVFEHFQNLGLHGGLKVADLVEEQGTAAGGLDQPELALPGVGERAALMAEQLVLDEVGRQRGAVQLDEWPRSPSAATMQCLGHQLLAGAGLPDDQHRG